ncbi:hypothetical protein JKA73_36370 [Myxococcus xanthus]|uniref:hypothetical protein n=1 Tax=Myxococcus xanthus TaxID=34 RepID=UPI001917327B|nr:hypothetical protein [Myxococcus xanthus]QQR44383.1 hypothetical protein JKA73_36370 [Myxococcus xanthus]
MFQRSKPQLYVGLEPPVSTRPMLPSWWLELPRMALWLLDTLQSFGMVMPTLKSSVSPYTDQRPHGRTSISDSMRGLR